MLQQQLVDEPAYLEQPEFVSIERNRKQPTWSSLNSFRLYETGNKYRPDSLTDKIPQMRKRSETLPHDPKSSNERSLTLAERILT